MAEIITKTEQMTSLERVATACQFKEPDRVPTFPLFLGAMHRFAGISFDEWSRCENVPAMVQAHLDAFRLIGHDALVTATDLSVEAGDLGQEIIYPTYDTAHPNYDNPFIKDPRKDYRKLPKVNPRKVGRMKGTIDLIAGLSKEIGKTHAIVGFVYGTIGIISMMRGPERFFQDLIEYPDEVMAAVEFLDDILTDYVKAQLEAGAHGICYDNLYGSQTILSKDMWDKFEGDSVKKIMGVVHDAGALVAFHNCGNGPYFDSTEKFGKPHAFSHAYVADDVDSWEEQKTKWGHKIATIGWIPPGPVCMLGTHEELVEECKAEIEIFAKGGGFILASGCEYPPNASLYNAKLIVESAKKYGVYA